MKKVAQWELFELQLTTQETFANPFLDVELKASFACEDKEWTVDGFYDGITEGQPTWRIRFAPTRQGLWSYVTKSNTPELDGQTGSFLCTEPLSSGGLTINPHFASWFFREDGSPQWIVNEGWYPHPANGTFYDYEEVDFQQPSEQDMLFYLRTLSEYSVNMIIDMGQLYARQSSITDPSFRWPWAVVDPIHNKIDKDRFNLDYYQRLDRFLEEAKKHEIFFALELLYDNSVVRPREWANHPLNIKNGGWLEGNAYGTGWGDVFDLTNPIHVKYTARYLKYTIARVAAYWNVIWSIGSENGNLIRLPQEILPYALYSPEKTAAWYHHWGDYIGRKDPYGRLRTYGDTGRQPLMVTAPYNNIIVTQDPRNYPKDNPDAYYQAMNDFGESFWYYGRPTVIGEMTAGTGGHYDMERRLYWIGLVSGYMMGRADRHFSPVDAEQLSESKKFNVNGIPPIYADLKRMTHFIKDQKIPFWRMRPSDESIQTDGTMVFCLAAREEVYLLYFVHGGKASMELPKSQYCWFSPTTGRITESGTTEPGYRTFLAPDEEDWVLLIRAEQNLIS
ncbi:MAG: DUF5060 domain-containing protein [Clostridia bacterium]|nr:DUF5060 domain-containing protein [Clostridia bacterium]